MVQIFFFFRIMVQNSYKSVCYNFRNLQHVQVLSDSAHEESPKFYSWQLKNGWKCSWFGCEDGIAILFFDPLRCHP